MRNEECRLESQEAFGMREEREAVLLYHRVTRVQVGDQSVLGSH